MSLLFPIALSFGLLVGSLGLSLLALVRARAVAQDTGRQARTAREEQEAALAAMRQIVDDLAAQVHEIRVQPAAVPVPGAAPRAALNLSKRSQALRMHRRGEAPQKIASSLEIPRQELELLLKVHRIVMSNI
jgi:hypothetical protein